MSSTVATPATSAATLADVESEARRLVAEVERSVRGKHEAVRMTVACLLARGHLLVEDAPGLGKTVLARALAQSLRLDMKRIQLTPDLLPSDITGTEVRGEDHTFVFRPGPVFAHIVIADEINRASPKTQSALLEVMEEQRVTIDGKAHALTRPFMLVATQNPIEMEGTFPLPEAQLDRFLMKLSLGYADSVAEREILDLDGAHGLLDAANTTDEHVHGASCEHLRRLVAAVATVRVPDAVADYIVQLANRSRTLDDVLRHGASTRATVALRRAAQAWAAMDGREMVLPDDVQDLLEVLWAHRFVPVSRIEAAEARVQAIATLLKVPVPR